MSDKQPTEFERYIRDVIKPPVWESAHDGEWVDMLTGERREVTEENPQYNDSAE